jgi:thiamine-phosphate pyrophosphorylase
LLQYRDKHATTRELIERAQHILEALTTTRVPLLINDRADVALIVGAAGVHLGQDDMTPREARRIVGEAAIIGRTVKNEAHAAAIATEAVDYACIGGVYVTHSKHNPDPPVGIAGFKALRAMIHAAKPALPIGAIAGIDLDRTQEIISAGADGIAVIGAIFREPDITHAAKALRRAIDIARASS